MSDPLSPRTISAFAEREQFVTVPGTGHSTLIEPGSEAGKAVIGEKERPR